MLRWEKFQLETKLKLPLISGFTLSHSISCVGSCRPFVPSETSSEGLVGCRKFLLLPTEDLQEPTQLIEWDDGEA